MQSPNSSNQSFDAAAGYSAESPTTNGRASCSPDKQQHSEVSTVSPVSSSFNDPKDDFEIMLLHEDFPFLLQIAANTKETRKKIDMHTVRPLQPFQQLAKSSLQPDDILATVNRIQETFLARGATNETIPRGRFPVTDQIMEECMLTLQREHESGEQWLQEQQQQQQQGGDYYTKKRERGKESSSKAIAIKFSKWQTDILMNWMIEHKEQPFPDQSDIEWLMSQTGLTQSQVVNWTTNVRKRNRKATCENGKKPHHFIDFLFLAQDRDERQEKAVILQQQQSTIRSSSSRGNYHLPMQQHSRPVYRPPYQQSRAAVFPPDVPSMPPHAGYRYQHQPAARHHSLAPVPEMQPSSMVDLSIEPMPMEAKTEDELMAEFADNWLIKEPIADIDVGPELLPSVTNDSNDAVPTPAARARAPSFEMEDADTDFEKWVDDLGAQV